LLDSLLQEIIVSMSSVIKGKMPAQAILFQDPTGNGMPFDVTFVIVEADTSNFRAEEGLDKGVTKDAREIKAHKYILAASSSVFKSMFFGSMKESKNVIEVRETTFEAFKKLIEYIYHVDIECKDIILDDLYDIVNLAELYDMPSLMEELKIQMENIPLSMDNLMDVASTASAYSQFEEISQAVMMSCAKFLQKTVSDKLEFALTQHSSGKGDIALDLLALVKLLPPLVVCSNCRGEPCKVGQGVPHAMMRQGLKMKMVGYYPTSGNVHQVNTVVTVNYVDVNGRVTVDGYNQSYERHSYSSSWEEYGAPKMTFVYNC